MLNYSNYQKGMNNSSAELTLIHETDKMSSLEIAELTGKNHKDVMRSIRKMELAWEEVCGRKFTLTSRKVNMPNGGFKKEFCYELSKTECLYIATKFNDGARAKLVLRWEELERGKKPKKAERTPTLTTKVRVSLEWVKGVSDILNLNDSSKLSMLKMVAEPLGLPTPDYTKSKGILKSASELLKANNSKLSCQEFNKIMIDKGFIKVMTRESSKGEKKFKSIIGDGLNYGENQVNPNNPKETQPLYYEEKFNKLLKLLAAN